MTQSSTPAFLQGPASLPVAYQRMLQRDVHAPDSVDRVLISKMIRLTEVSADYLYRDYTPTHAILEPGSRPELEAAVRRALKIPSLESHVASLESLRQVTTYLAAIASRADDIPLEDLVFGGTEERIIARTTDWCTDLARAACVMLHVAGAAARIVCLFDTARAYSGHQVIEAYVEGSWVCADPVHGFVHERSDGTPASALDVMRERRASPDNRNALFRAVFLVSYNPMTASTCNFTESAANAYYLSILTQSSAGWPGGLRWLHGEDG
ncbi:MAG: transglutaminase domain-containing protein [Chloroflexota bacterium]|nr:transglutaminase domain-containing protein [Chloroflexota bacterium]MDE2920122.1 transglutaminase domain-containing protein [Chloroflexota bacterium]